MPYNCSTASQPKATKKNEKVTLTVVIITLIMMITEIVAGLLSGSMALLSDGIHMGTHAIALFITLMAYIIARRNWKNPAFSFGTGKVGVLGGYTNAILLILAGVAMAYESIERLIDPVEIHFNEAIAVAVIGLGINVISAVILGMGEGQHGDPHHGHSHSREKTKTSDHNLRAAYLHVITDALTSVLAIFALLTGKYLGLIWTDPLVGILGAVVVVKWAIGLIRQTGAILLDLGDFSPEIRTIREKLEEHKARVTDIHIWQLSENERSLIVSLETPENRNPSFFHRIILETACFEHITIEINQKPELSTGFSDATT